MPSPETSGFDEQSFLNRSTSEKVKNYVEMGLTVQEASDLVSLQSIKQQGGTLSETEIERKQQYIAKLK